MEKRIIDRVLKVSNYMIETGDTVRQLGKVFNISKSTVHKDLSERLLEIDVNLYQRVNEILQYHSSVRHIRGGESTRRKFLEKNAN